MGKLTKSLIAEESSVWRASKLLRRPRKPILSLVSESDETVAYLDKVKAELLASHFQEYTEVDTSATDAKQTYWKERATELKETQHVKVGLNTFKNIKIGAEKVTVDI